MLIRRKNTFSLVVALWLGAPPWAGSQASPSYSAGSIVNAASNAPTLASDTYATIYGLNLSPQTIAVSGKDFSQGKYPRNVAGVQVLVAGIRAVLTYVSPGQINFLMPSGLESEEVPVQVISGAIAGPPVTLALAQSAPALFLCDLNAAVASHSNYSLVTSAVPALPGEIIVLWATGLGPTVPGYEYGDVPRNAAPLVRSPDFRVLLDNRELPSASVLYAGIAPGFAGLYQINLVLPHDIGNDPEVRIALGTQISPPGIRIPVRKCQISNGAQHPGFGVRLTH